MRDPLKAVAGRFSAGKMPKTLYSIKALKNNPPQN